MITKRKFGEIEGQTVYAFTVSSDTLSVEILNYGGIIRSVILTTPSGNVDVCMGYDALSEYIESGAFCGAVIGRVAGRLLDGTFALNGKTYHIENNDSAGVLHGGYGGFDKQVFDVTEQDNSLLLHYYSIGFSGGFPANIDFYVRYSVDGNRLIIDYSATADSDTLLSPTSHVYFMLDDTAGDSKLTINADSFLPLSPSLLPTGEIKPVHGTPFDFTSPKKINDDINCDDVQLKIANGYDHTFVLSRGGIMQSPILCATAVSEKNGVTLNCYTDMPGVHLYTANFVKDSTGKGRRLGKRCAFCLETQFFPNAINTSSFTPPILKKGGSFKSRTVFEFNCP